MSAIRATIFAGLCLVTLTGCPLSASGDLPDVFYVKYAIHEEGRLVRDGDTKCHWRETGKCSISIWVNSERAGESHSMALFRFDAMPPKAKSPFGNPWPNDVMHFTVIGRSKFTWPANEVIERIDPFVFAYALPYSKLKRGFEWKVKQLYSSNFKRFPRGGGTIRLWATTVRGRGWPETAERASN